jgi:hypothetical protein
MFNLINYVPNADEANCQNTDPDIFFPEVFSAGSEKTHKMLKAIDVCARCDILQQCLDYALTNEEEFGIWGGATQYERRIMERDKSIIPEHIRAMEKRKKVLTKKEEDADVARARRVGDITRFYQGAA